MATRENERRADPRSGLRGWNPFPSERIRLEVSLVSPTGDRDNVWCFGVHRREPARSSDLRTVLVVSEDAGMRTYLCRCAQVLAAEGIVEALTVAPALSDVYEPRPALAIVDLGRASIGSPADDAIRAHPSLAGVPLILITDGPAGLAPDDHAIVTTVARPFTARTLQQAAELVTAPVPPGPQSRDSVR